MFKFKRLSLAALAVIATFSIPSAKASSILIDQGSMTYDPATHIQWLDLSATMGLSYSGVATQTDYLQTGWRFATENEVANLYRDAGIPVITKSDGTFSYSSDWTQPGYLSVAQNAFALGNELGWGSGKDSAPEYFTAGFFNVPATSEHPLEAAFTFLLLNDYEGYYQQSGTLNISEGINTIDPDQAVRGFGNFLVRDVSPVPIPGEAVPLGALLLGLTGFNLWRRKQQGLSQM